MFASSQAMDYAPTGQQSVTYVTTSSRGYAAEEATYATSQGGAVPKPVPSAAVREAYGDVYANVYGTSVADYASKVRR